MIIKSDIDQEADPDDALSEEALAFEAGEVGADELLAEDFGEDGATDVFDEDFCEDGAGDVFAEDYGEDGAADPEFYEVTEELETAFVFAGLDANPNHSDQSDDEDESEDPEL